ncbi:MAG TPA: hypothetical protein VGJ66_04935 [Pyrinomonadaceae bacterium]|jgi:hypothetical protein
MVKRWLLVVIIGVALVLPSSIAAAPSSIHATQSSIVVDDFTAKSYTLGVVYRLAAKYHVVIGVYGTVSAGDNREIDISIKNGTVGDALNAITKADPRFEWHEGSNGAITSYLGVAPLV